jgi:glycosyltransferase involved in cell wall biosynthesis
LQGLRLAVVEWTTPTDRRDALQVLRRACDGAGAKGHIRFVLTPTGWFDFEDAIHGLVEQLRRMPLQRLQSASPPTPGARLAMPPPRHSWFVDSSRSAWAWEQMLMNAHHAGFGRHLVELARQGGLAVEAARSPGLRALMQRLAHERRTPELLSVLRDLYRRTGDRAALAAADAQFAAAHDLGRFGGPWAGGLGLGATTARVRPFTIGKTRKAGAEVAPDVTVLVPSYNHGAYIQECLQSVLAQRHTSFRLLVVDDCSPDDTVEKTRARSDRWIEVRVNCENLGLGNSVLAALATIDTPYVALLNSDDLYHPDRLGRCCKVLDGQPEVNLVTTGMRLVDADGGEIDAGNASLALDGQQVFDWVHWFAKAKPRGELSQDELLPALLERNFLVTSSNIVCRTDWLRARAESLRSLKYCLAWQLFLDAARERSLRHIDEPLLAYRLHASNTVWFRGGRRWAFYLEVNRVVAGALRGWIADIPAASDRLLELLRLLAGPVLRNRECDGAAMFVNAVCDAVQADAIAAQLTAVQAEELRVAQQDAQAPRADQGELARRLQASEEAEGLARRRAEGLLRDRDAVRGDLQIQREQAAVVAEVRDLVHRELAGLRAEHDRLAGELQE